MDDKNIYATPESELRTPSSTQITRKKNLLILNKSEGLPRRCIHCNEAAEHSRKANLYYMNPWWYLLIFVNLLVLVIVSAFVGKRAKVDIPFCSTHARKFRNLRWSGFGLFLLGIVCFIAAAQINIDSNTTASLMITIGVVLMLASLIVAIIATPLRAAKMDKHKIWIKGCKEPFLSTFPEEQP